MARKCENDIPFHLRLSASVPDTAKATGLSESNIWNKISEGKLTAVKVGGRTLVVVASAKALLSLTDESIAA